MSIKSNLDYEKERNTQVSKIRSFLDYAMGVVIVAIGIFLFFRYKMDIKLNKVSPPDVWDKVYGFVAFVYGCWRIYRAYKKNYFK